ncbi:MAG: C10 family peptidase [Bacteroidales bacterium]|nr:C10 family peptidase [Bacteroidales bacterium]
MKYTFNITRALCIIVVFYISFASDVLSKEVSIIKAKKVAFNILYERYPGTHPNLIINNIIEEKSGNITLFYIFNFSGNGYAIIAADNSVYPVLAYSTTSNFDPTDIPDGAKWMLNKYKRQIKKIINNQIPPSYKTKSDWDYYGSDSQYFTKDPIESVEPLLTSQWGQGWFYNELCPLDAGTTSGHVPVGCAAVAMAQVMNYWNHPWKGNGSNSYVHNDYGTQSADFYNALYNYDSMPNSLTSSNLFIANLMYHCAVSVDMDFGPEGSNAYIGDVDDALRDHFYFDDAVNVVLKSSHPGQGWHDILQGELNLKRPVIYRGYDAGEAVGHMWVVDGYQGTEHYHMNWGWGGNWDDYYYLTDLTPDDNNFGTSEMAIIDIFPETDNLSGTLSAAGGPYYFRKTQIVQPFQTLTIEPGTEIYFAGRYRIHVFGQLEALGTIADSIIISSELAHIGWQGIRFYQTDILASDSSRIINCVLKQGKGKETVVNGFGGIKGGAIYCEKSSRVRISNSSIVNNSAEYGGGIACYDSSHVSIKNCVIANDAAIMGGGIYLSTSNAVLSNNIIQNNECSSNGGGIFSHNCNPVFSNDTIRHNYAGFGGGMGFNQSQAILNNVIIHDNEARVDAGGIYTSESGIELNNVQLYYNEADSLAGGILCYFNSPMQLNRVQINHNMAPVGSALCIVDASPTLTNVTISDNISNPDQAAIYIQEGNLTMENSIVWFNIPKQIDTSGVCIFNPTYSIIEGLYWQGTGVIHQDPKFESPIARDYRLTWDEYPLPDGDKSAAIDAGNPSSPEDADGTIADMGAIPHEQTYTPIAGGSINGTLNCAGSPYYVFGNLEIAETEELIIEPCVTVIFRGDYQLKVLGRLQAEGNTSNKITFAPSDTLEGWQGIRFINTKSNGLDSSRLVHCRITYGNANGWNYEKRGGAMYFSSSGNVLISNCLVNKNKAENNGGAIYSTGSSGPLFQNNIFENNYAPTGGVFYGNSTGNLYFNDNLFQHNRANSGGALCAYSSNIFLAGNTLRHNKAEQFGGGIYYASGGNFLFDADHKNNIYLNYAGAAGLDLFYDGYQSFTTVIADTFTVLQPNKHFAYPIEKFTINLDHGIIEQTDSDLYVSMSGSDDNTGTSASDPLETMYMACLKILADETNPHTIFLDNGTYSEGATGEVFPINWRDHVSLHGSDIDETLIYGENKNQLLFCYDDSGFTIDSLTFEGGYGKYGGGIRFEEGSSPMVSNILVKNNYAVEDGGGISCRNYSSPVFSKIEVKYNSCDKNGGGISCYYNSNASILNSLITENFALYLGGGISAYMYCQLVVDTTTIYRNTAVHGGGILNSWGSNGTFKNSIIQSNEALSHVSGYFGTAGGVWVSYQSSPLFENVEIKFNSADWEGGGLYTGSACYPVFNKCKIESNDAKIGGGIYLTGNANNKFYNTIIAANTTTDNHGGGIYNDNSNPEFINSTITGNTANNPGLGGALYSYNGTPTFKNSIIWDNSPNEFEVANGNIVVEFSDVDGGYAGPGNINSDPLFETFYGLYNLSSESPCINAGNPDTTGLNLPDYDLAGNPRIANDTIDMGAFEYPYSLELINLDVTVFLEGPFNGTDMNTDLTTALPLMQPYNTSPWNYTGSESVTTIPNPDIVDWVLIELRDAVDAASALPSTTVARQAAFLMKDGSIRGLDGNGPQQFASFEVENSLFVVIMHRNHLSVMSAYPALLSGDTYTYDFSSGILKAYNSGHKDLGGIYGLFAGDADANNTIDFSDKTSIWENQAGESGYLNGDVNLDGFVNNPDKNDLLLPNIGNSSQVPQ